MKVNAYAVKEPKGKLVPFSYESGELSPENIDIKVSYCGLCHSDMSMMNNDWGMTQYPIVPGHEIIGEIVAVGNAVKNLKAQKVIETGVAYGWSSLAILKALTEIGNGKLYSVDMPYPRRNNEKDVGIVVPEFLKKNWFLLRKPDQPGILEAIKMSGGDIDLCHYDSDKSWWGRNYAYPLLWKALKVGGLFICDDIQDNLFFF